MFRVVIFSTLIALCFATDFRQCTGKPKPKDIRVKDCEKLPCKVVKGTNSITEIDFTPDHNVEKLTTKVMATALGVTIPYALPEELSDVCQNLLNDGYCPLDSDEDATFKLTVPIASYYPEIPVTLEISLVDEEEQVVACFETDIQVTKN